MRRARPIAPHAYTLAAAGAFLIAAWLCLVNLDYAALWHDEAPAAVVGKALLQQGDIVGWDGRNLVGGTNGRMLNAQLRDVWPPLMYVLNAAGFAVFGVNEVGARIVHALMGIAALGAFYLLLRQHLPGSGASSATRRSPAGEPRTILWRSSARPSSRGTTPASSMPAPCCP